MFLLEVRCELRSCWQQRGGGLDVSGGYFVGWRRKENGENGLFNFLVVSVRERSAILGGCFTVEEKENGRLSSGCLCAKKKNREENFFRVFLFGNSSSQCKKKIMIYHYLIS